jgi:DnaK suppressor protein
VNTDHYKRRLVAEEQRLLARMGRAGGEARESTSDVHDAGDASTDDVRKDAAFAEADTDWKTLEEVRQALRRIEDGTYGRCVVDGGPIEEKRLDALPWTPVCSRHAELDERSRPPRTPTL